MKARLYCCIPINADGRLMRICRKAKLFDADASTIQNFNKYLLASLDTDFPFYCMKGLQRVLCDIEKMGRLIDRWPPIQREVRSRTRHERCRRDRIDRRGYGSLILDQRRAMISTVAYPLSCIDARAAKAD